jgi:hypothetical protein
MFLVVVNIPGRLPCKFHGGYHGDILFLFWVGYHGGIIGHNTRKLLFVLLTLVLVPGRSHVIASRKRYNDNCTCSCSCSEKVIGDSSKRDL